MTWTFDLYFILVGKGNCLHPDVFLTSSYELEMILCKYKYLQGHSLIEGGLGPFRYEQIEGASKWTADVSKNFKSLSLVVLEE